MIVYDEGWSYVEFKAGDFALVDIRSDIGNLIRIGQWLNGDGFGHYEHALIYDGQGGVFEATPKHGIEHNRLSEYAPGSLYWSSGIIELTSAQRANIIQAAWHYIGVPYSFLDYAALATHRLHIPAPGLRAYIKSTGHMICSQFVDQCYSDAGVQLFANRWQGYVTPGDLYNLLLKSSARETVYADNYRARSRLVPSASTARCTG